MKISNTTQNIAQEELKKQGTKETKQAQTSQKKAPKLSAGQNTDTSEIKNNPFAQDVKRLNSDIGKLQIAQKSLQVIEADAKKIANLSEEMKETFDKAEQDEIKEEIGALKKNIESTLKNATFEGNNVFSKNIKDNKEQVIFDAQKLNTKLLNTDAQKFYSIVTEQQTQVKDAIQTLQKQAQESTNKIVQNSVSAKDTNMEETNGSFLKKFGSLFRTSHNTEKLNNQRVQELLA